MFKNSSDTLYVLTSQLHLSNLNVLVIVRCDSVSDFIYVLWCAEEWTRQL